MNSGESRYYKYSLLNPEDEIQKNMNMKSKECGGIYRG